MLNGNLGNCIFSVQSDGAYVTYTPTGGADSVTKKLGDYQSSCEVLKNTGAYQSILEHTTTDEIKDGLIILFDNNIGGLPNIQLSSGTSELLSNYSGTSSFLNGYVCQRVFRIHDVNAESTIKGLSGTGSAYLAMQIISI